MRENIFRRKSASATSSVKAKLCKIIQNQHFASSFDVSCRISGVSFCSRLRHLDISRHRHRRPRAEIPLRVSAPNPSGVACDSQVTLLAVCHCAIEVEKGNEGDKECEHSTYPTCVNMSMITMIVNGITVNPFTFHLPVNHCEPLPAPLWSRTAAAAAPDSENLPFVPSHPATA